MSDDTTAVATKADLSKLEQTMKWEIADIRSVMATKDDLKDMKNTIISEMKHYFDFTVETIRHDLLGANKDDIGVMKDRITRLEKHTGLVTQ